MGRTGITGARVLAEMVRFRADSRAALCRRLHMSKASISRLVDRLMRAGLIEEGAKLDHPRRGRKTTSLRVRPDLAYMVGADLEGSAVRACVLDCSGVVLASAQRAVAPSWSIDRAASVWQGVIGEVIAACGAPRDRLIGLGVGLPGMVFGGESIRIRAFLPPGRAVDFEAGPALSSFGIPVCAGNNTECVSEYERRLGLARGAKSFISVLARYGIGAAVFSHGSFLVGEGAFTGELSHMRIDPNGPVCLCGQRGCLDAFAGGRTWPAAAKRHGAAWTSGLQERSRHIGVGLANLLKIFHPPLVLMNGIYNDYEGIVRPALTDTLAEELERLGISVPEVVFGEPEALKTSIGAAFRAADSFLEKHLLARGVGCADSGSAGS